MIKSPDYINALKPYVPGKPVEEVERELGIREAVKIASNENPLGPSPKAMEVIRNTDFKLNRYPDGGGFYLKQRLASFYGLPEDNFILGNGSNELLNIAALAYMTDNDGAVMGVPSFVVYYSATRSVGAEAIQVPLIEYRHDLKSMAKAIKENTKMVFIANPNNPTGGMNTSDELAAFMDAVPENVLVVLDEAYYEYVTASGYPDSFRYLNQGRDILILRTFSKIHGLAGLRIGDGIAKKEIVTELDKVRPPFNTSTIAQAAAIAALDDKAHVERSIATNNEGKAYLFNELKGISGVECAPTEANFVFLILKDASAPGVNEQLMKRGVIARPMGEKALRVTIGLPDENKKFINAFKEILG